MLLTDVRSAFKALWHSKAFATVAILCLGFGIGLNTTIFSIVDGVLLKPLPYADSERLVVVRASNGPQGVTETGLSFADVEDLRAASRALVDFAPIQFRSLALSDGEHEPDRFPGAAISWNLFPMLGVVPVAGQGLTPDMDRPGAERVVLLSHAVWRSRYNLDPGIVGRKVLINNVPSVVIGVMPEHFEFPQNQKLWVPLSTWATEPPRNQRDLYVFARMAPGASLDAVRAELTTQAATLASHYPATNKDWTAYPLTLREEFIPADVTLVIWIMMASVTLVLLIACSNVANLQLARASTRIREFSVRAALGAGRGRIVRQLLTESAVLGLTSVPLGVGLALVGTRMIASAMPADQVPYYVTWEVDWRTVLYAVVVALLTAILFGLLPAVQTSRKDLVHALKDAARGSSGRRSRLRSALVVAQVALALVSLVGALLFVRTFANLNAYDVGFDPRPLMTMRFYMPGDIYELEDAKARRVEDIIRRVEALPRVQSAFASNLVPISGGGGGANIIIDGVPSEPGKEPGIAFVGVTPHFHRTLGVAMTQGRDFSDAEGWSRLPVAVINQTMATRHWPQGGAVGGRFRQVTREGSGDWFTVIGVAPDIKHDDIDPEDQPFSAAYVPYAFQETFSTGLIVRVDGDPASIMPAIRDAIRSSDPNIPIAVVRTMEEVRQISFWQFGLFGWIFGVTGFMGLVLALVGVYGVLSYAVQQRSGEIGVRMALGAARRDVLRLIVGHGLALAGLGVVVGLAVAPLGTYAGRTLFYNVGPFDPVTFISVAGFLMAVAFLASYLPARRATRVNPVVVLRGE